MSLVRAQTAGPLPANRGLLRFLTCGSVDDGKSTLIGRLLYESKIIKDDRLSELAADSRRYGTLGDEMDLALLVDGLQAEREQGITIDVAYQFFSTPRRSFIVADTPGHEQYTRNMATGASTAQVAVILIDARKGVVVQTKRHSFICSLLGIRHVVVAVNKMDLVDFSLQRFERIAADYRTFADALKFRSIEIIPISARYGDNVTVRSAKTAWYGGPTLIELLETVQVESNAHAKPLRFPVQSVVRPNSDFRGFAGTVASGEVRCGDDVLVAGSGQKSKVKRIISSGRDQDSAGANDAIMLVLTDEIDVTRGDVLVAPQHRPEVVDQFAAHVIWMNDEPLVPGRSYLLRIGTRTVPATVSSLKYSIDVNTFEHLACKTLALNEIAFCNMSTAVPVAFDNYEDNRATGGFIIIDRFNNNTLGAGMISFGLRRASNIHVQQFSLDKQQRAALKHQKPAVLWLTGLSGAGKSTIANLVEKQLHVLGHHTMSLDGDNVRHGLNRDLGFSEADRVENIRRAGEVAKLMLDCGLIVICSFISPYRAERKMVRELVDNGEFFEVFIDTPLEECIKRDPKGLYIKALAGQIKNFTGVDAPYEIPQNPELHLKTIGRTPNEIVEDVLRVLRDRGIVQRIA
ncbi:MAG: sulfate adenylyltransferase subunit CysN [Pseudolabrys sp.]